MKVEDSESEVESDFERSYAQLDAPCVYLDETKEEMEYQVDMFSRTLNPKHWTNALNISKAIGHKDLLHVHTWELLDKAFSFPRVRRYGFVQENMDMLEHFQDNLNTNISNSDLMNKFIDAGKQVKTNFQEKYHDGEFADPAKVDPKDLIE